MLAIIGGTGLGEALGNGEGTELDVPTPFGPPSAPIRRLQWGGSEVYFLNRHGAGHRFNPSTVPYRANIFALKSLGVTTVIASGAVGSLREEMCPGDLVVCDQVIDKTFRRAGTFFHDEMAIHIELAEPFCPRLRERILAHRDRCASTVHDQGTYVCMEGPQFSTRAESLMHRQWGGDLVGMTAMPEAKLAREAELAYALVAMVTDYDCWRPHGTDGSPTGETEDRQALLQEIMHNLKRATENAIGLIRTAVESLAAIPLKDSPAFAALSLAIWTDKSAVPRRALERLRPLLGRHFSE